MKLLADDFPHLSMKLQSAFKGDNGELEESILLNVYSEVSATIEDLVARGFSNDGRLMKTIILAQKVLDRLTDDYIPF